MKKALYGVQLSTAMSMRLEIPELRNSYICAIIFPLHWTCLSTLRKVTDMRTLTICTLFFLLKTQCVFIAMVSVILKNVRVPIPTVRRMHQ